jgi:hypothetical protein
MNNYKPLLEDIPIITEKPPKTDKMFMICEKYDGFIDITEANGYGNITVNFSKIEPGTISNVEYIDIAAFIIYKCLSALYISGKYQKKRIIAHGRLNNCTIKHFSLKFYKFIAGILDATFPERLERWYFYGSNKFFRLIWNLLYKFIDPITRAKFFLIKSKYLSQHRIPDTCFIDYIVSNDQPTPNKSLLDK